MQACAIVLNVPLAELTFLGEQVPEPGFRVPERDEMDEPSHREIVDSGILQQLVTLADLHALEQEMGEPEQQEDG